MFPLTHRYVVGGEDDSGFLFHDNSTDIKLLDGAQADDLVDVKLLYMMRAEEELRRPPRGDDASTTFVEDL